MSARKAFAIALAVVLASLMSVLTAGTAVAAPTAAVSSPASAVEASFAPTAFTADNDDDEDWDDEDNDDSHESKPAPKPVAKVSPQVVEQLSGSSTGARALAAARSLAGAPYVSGGNGASGVDCSGLVAYGYKKAGVSLPRKSTNQAAMGREIPISQAQPGDILSYGSPVYHVMLYVRPGVMFDAAGDGGPAREHKYVPDMVTHVRRI